jgi:hypothetical protein
LKADPEFHEIVQNLPVPDPARVWRQDLSLEYLAYVKGRADGVRAVLAFFGRTFDSVAKESQE